MTAVDTVTGEIVATGDMGEAEARERLGRVKGHVAAAWDDLVALWSRRAWLSLGHPSWDALCDAELDGARIALPREQRREVVGRMREAGMSKPAIARAVGVSLGTVHNDVNLSEVKGPATIVGLDGRHRPATRDVEAEAAAAVERHPDLNVRHAAPAEVVKVARALDQVSAEDYGRRVAAGRNWLEYKARGGQVTVTADPTTAGDQLVGVAQVALSALAGSGAVWGDAWDSADPIQRSTWRATLSDLRTVLDDLLGIATTELRRIK